MLEIRCSGTPREIGEWHGRLATTEVKRSVAFYQALLQQKSGLNWDEVCTAATKFVPYLRDCGWGKYLEEMMGLAAGAGVDFASILALNVRTEVAYGMALDGCTALSWMDGDESFLAQNWDWESEQKENLISLHIIQAGKPSIHMITEAGIIGKIGLNGNGVGVTLNAIKAKGVDFRRLPCHLALRTVLESPSRQVAVETLEKHGVASSCHILVADATGGTGVEVSAIDIVLLPMEKGTVTHTNHFIEPHLLEHELFLPDTEFRLKRIRELLKADGGSPSIKKIENMLDDEENFPKSICRDHDKESTVETLFSIVMDLKRKQASFRLGRPISPEAKMNLEP